MKEWAYKATRKKRSLLDTRRLAEEHGFLARSAHRKDRALVPSVKEVSEGDILHFYYREKKRVEALGSYRILAPDGMRFRSALGGDSAIVMVDKESPENQPLLAALRGSSDEGEGYREDPKLHCYTGFRIERVAGIVTPKFEVWSFPQKGTLTRERVERASRSATEDTLLARITHDAGVMAGKACIRGMRVTVGMILGLFAAGRSEEEILEEYPYLESLDLRAALTYAAYRLQEREIPLKAA